MKRTIFFIIAVCLLLAGCSVIRQTDETGEPVPVSVIDLPSDEQPYRVQKGAVYFYNKTSDTLSAEIRNLVIGQDENPARAAVEALLEGPSEGSGFVAVAPESMELDFIEFTGSVANVYLKYTGEELEPLQKYTLELAVTNTVTDILGAKYVCIFYNEEYTGFSGANSAPLEKHSGSVQEAYNQTSAKYIGALEPQTTPGEGQPADGQPAEEPQPTTDEQEPSTDGQNSTADESDELIQVNKTTDIQTVLYFVSYEGGFILPEVRNITYTDDNYAEVIFRELMAGPTDTTTMRSLLPSGLELLSPPIISDDKIKISLSKLPSVDDFDDEGYEASYAALSYTLTGFLPGITSIDITVLGQPISDFDDSYKLANGMQRSDYHGFIGSSAPIYFTDKNSDLLLVVQHSMEQASTWSAKQRILEILRGPLSSDTASAWPVITTGVTQDDILSVQTYNDTVYVNLSQNFKEACDDLSAKNEMLLVYSIVNTLTSMDGINKVQFLIEGEQIDELSGTLCMSDPFLKNYDIIKE